MRHGQSCPHCAIGLQRRARRRVVVGLPKREHAAAGVATVEVTGVCAVDPLPVCPVWTAAAAVGRRDTQVGTHPRVFAVAAAAL